MCKFNIGTDFLFGLPDNHNPEHILGLLCTFSCRMFESTCSRCTGRSATLSYLRVLPSPDQDVLSLSFCLSLHPNPAAASGNALRDRAATLVMMPLLLTILHTPRRPKARRRSLVLIAPAGALPTGQSKLPRHAIVVMDLLLGRTRCVVCPCLHLRLVLVE